MFTISPKEPNLRLHATHAKQALLLGIDAQGCIRILRNQEEKSVVGSLHSVISIQRKEGRKTILMKRVHETAGYRSSGQHDERIPCFHAGSGQHFMLYAERSVPHGGPCNKPDQDAVQGPSTKADPAQAVPTDSVLLSVSAVDAQANLSLAIDDESPSSVGSARRPRKARQKLTLEQEQVLLQRIGAAQASGVEIFLLIEEVECWAKLPVSSIYRKISQKRFPPPLKRGKNSVWSLSSLWRYQNGTWKPDAA